MTGLWQTWANTGFPPGTVRSTLPKRCSLGGGHVSFGVDPRYRATPGWRLGGSSQFDSAASSPAAKDRPHRGDLRGEPQLRQPVRRLGRGRRAGRRPRPHPDNQVDADGTPLPCLPQNDVNLDLAAAAGHLHRHCRARSTLGVRATPRSASTTTSRRGHHLPRPGSRSPRNGVAQGQRLARRLHPRPGAPLLQRAVPDRRRPADRYAAGSDAARPDDGALRHRALPIYQYLHSPGAPLRIADHFFQARLRRVVPQPPVADRGRTPTWPGAVADGGPDDLHSIVGPDGFPAGTRCTRRRRARRTPR